MTSADSAAPRPKWRSRGYLVTMGTVLALAGGLGLTAFGLGSADQAVASTPSPIRVVSSAPAITATA